MQYIRKEKEVHFYSMIDQSLPSLHLPPQPPMHAVILYILIYAVVFAPFILDMSM